MKGKLKFGLKILTCAVLMLSLGLCFVSKPKDKHNKELTVHAVATLDNQEYSALLGGNVVLSVEKVGVDVDGNYSSSFAGAKTFYTRTPESRIVKYSDSASIDMIKKDVGNGLAVFYANADGELKKVASPADVDDLDNRTYYIGSIEEITGASEEVLKANVKKLLENKTSIYYVDEKTCVELKNIESFKSGTKYYKVVSTEIPYYFQDISENGKNKQVVESGQFVMLNNQNQFGKFVNPKTGKSDAIMISLGQYVYNGESVALTKSNSVGTNSDYSQMTYLEVELTRYGKPVPGLTRRNITTTEGGFFYDFSYLITEDGINDIEGHYVMTITYMKAGDRYTSDFNFYLVCETAYTKTVKAGNQTYTSAPTLGWTENGVYQEKLPEDGAGTSVVYNEGLHGITKGASTETEAISYPTITYDYTRYNLQYELSANKTITKYNYTYKVADNNVDAKMLCTVSGAVEDVKEFDVTPSYNKDLKLVTIVLTEPGSYKFSFQYVYTGLDAPQNTVMDKIAIQDKHLKINGAKLNYSKQNFTSAQFRKFNFYTNTNNENVSVDLIVPNGYLQTEEETNIEKYKNKAIGFMYTFNNEQNLKFAPDTNVRVGEIVVSNSSVGDRTEDTLQNFKIFSSGDNGADLQALATKVLTGDKKIKNYNFDFVRSNQGSMWISSSNKILETKAEEKVDTNGSFYFYKRSGLIEGEVIVGDPVPYNNQTSFNQDGYYLVFIKIDSKDNTASTGATSDDYWQVYAFQYVSDTIDIKVTTTDSSIEKNNGVDVGAGKYTKENVKITWEKPKTFESKIKAYYYYSANKDLSREEFITTKSPNILTSGDKLGADVKNNTFGKYLIKLERAGKSATYKMFTIDREPIKGINAFAVNAITTKNAVFYEISYRNNKPIQIENSITNSYATLKWDSKGSGAEITATYSYTPFISNSSITSTWVNGRWITTGYELGETIHNSDLEKVTSDSDVSYNSVLQGQGIYIFTIVDEAGNATKYMLIIDNTEAHIEINNNGNKEILPNGEFRLYGDNVTYTTGTHKAIALNTDGTGELDEILPYIVSESLVSYVKNEIKFYSQDGNKTIANLQKLFSNFGANYLTVKNNSVYAYNRNVIDYNCSAINSISGKLESNSLTLQGATSLIRTLYVVGENMTYSASFNINNPRQSISFVKIEINKDNARGMVYYSNDEFGIAAIPDDGGSNGSVVRLEGTGSDGKDVVGNPTYGINVAEAAKDQFFAFTWLVGEGTNFKVNRLEYQHYQLNLDKTNNINAENKYFYHIPEVDEPIVLYNVTPQTDELKILNGRGLYVFKNDYNDTTRAGLYVVTRYYTDEHADYGDDFYKYNYYFIVDRNGVHDVTQSIGDFISVQLLEGLTGIKKEELDTISTRPSTLQYDENNDQIFDITENYYQYFTTNRVPATVAVPTGKYFKDFGAGNYVSSSGYYSGQLKISVYFEDYYSQIKQYEEGKVGTYKIYQNDIPNSLTYYNISFYDYLYENNSNLLSKLIANSKDGKSWLHLKGKYIIVIEDNVYSSNARSLNKKIIGFEIKAEEFPQANVKIGATNVVENMSSAEIKLMERGSYSVVTNQEFLRVELPVPDSLSRNAQIDNEYIKVDRYYNGIHTQNYFVCDYGIQNGDGTLDSGCIFLDTKLRDSYGNIDKAGLNKPLVYTITIRYQIGLNENGKKERYKNCYTYYEYDNVGRKYNLKSYWYSTYTITIDRLAPTENILELQKSDELIKNGYINVDFEADYYGGSYFGEELSFTYQYKDYYNNGNKLSDIYAFKVNSKTAFNANDVETVYVSSKPIDKSELKTLNLGLPVTSYAGLTKKEAYNVKTYGSICNEGYYLVLEQDKAGNVTQYIVYCSDKETENLIIPIKYKPTDPSLADDPNQAILQTSLTIGLDNVKTIEMFNILNIEESSNTGDFFHYISLVDTGLIVDGWQPLKFVTNFSTNYATEENSIANLIANKIKNRKGRYELTIISRAGKAYHLAMTVYDAKDVEGLNVEGLKGQYENGKYYINLRGANNSKNNNYAKTITITEATEGTGIVTTKVYECRIESGVYNYYCEGNLVDVIIPCKDNTTYKIRTVDVFGQIKPTRFNTAGKEEFTLTFAGFNKYYLNEHSNYFAFTNFILNFDATFKVYEAGIIVKVDDVEEVDITKYLTITSTTVESKIASDFDAVINIIIPLREQDDSDAKIFNITIDTTTKPVLLKDAAGDSKDIAEYRNIDLTNKENLKEYTSENVTSGIMSLSWLPETKENFKYTYQLFELKNDNQFKEYEIDGLKNKSIITTADSTGKYWFVINVSSPDNILLGNKVFAFIVKQVDNQLYYVENKFGDAINPNSVFTIGDVNLLLTAGRAFDKALPSTLTSIVTNMPLYVTNHNLTVRLTDNVAQTEYVCKIDNNYYLKIYEISAKTYQIYFGVLLIEEHNEIVTGAKINDDELALGGMVTYVGTKSNTYIIKATKKSGPSFTFLNKNTILLEIEYNGQPVATEEFSGNIEYLIKGNGNYTFKIKDLAGNQHIFKNGTDSADVLILREVVVTLNDEVPVEKGYYNGRVSLKVFAATKYETGSISVTAERNGKPYTFKTSNPYIFDEYGTFVVTIKATIKDSEGKPHDLSKRLTFTLLNSQEVKTAIDLTNLNQYKITKVTNQNGDPITQEFLSMLSNKENGMLVTHDQVMEYADSLKVSAGKLLFTIEYEINDGIYPIRNNKLQFMLNNETPVVNSSLAIGESTTKDFQISFNPSIIYEQIGDSYVCINGKIVYKITSKSLGEEPVTLTRSYKANGAGDYYIQLVGTSGNVWQSFKVEIKEPLNASAIIIIIVVVGVVGTVVGTIIVLRRKMRIR